MSFSTDACNNQRKRPALRLTFREQMQIASSKTSLTLIDQMNHLLLRFHKSSLGPTARRQGTADEDYVYEIIQMMRKHPKENASQIVRLRHFDFCLWYLNDVSACRTLFEDETILHFSSPF